MDFLSELLLPITLLKFGLKKSNAMNAYENFIRIPYYLAEIDKNLNVLGRIV